MTEVGPLVMQLYDKTIYTYPIGAKAVGWCLALSSVMMVPLVAVKTLLQLPGSFSQVKTFSRPSSSVVERRRSNPPLGTSNPSLSYIII